MKLELMGLEELSAKERSSVSAIIGKLFDDVGLDDYSMTVSLVDEATMLDLCQRFKGKDNVTDVLSFPTPEMEKLFPHSKHLLGDIVICVEQARRQADEFGHNFIEEIAVLCAHGLFHLLGYDHEISDEEANIQMQGEMYLLEKAGLNAELSLIGRI